MDEKIRKKSCNNPMSICPICGMESDCQNEYCIYCGRRIIKPEKESEENQCKNCHASLEPGDKYCRVCGTKAGKESFAPDQNLMECIYGPRPVERTHVCKKCKHKWTTCQMLDNENHCPKCGGYAPPSNSPKKSGFRFPLKFKS